MVFGVDWGGGRGELKIKYTGHFDAFLLNQNQPEEKKNADLTAYYTEIDKRSRLVLK